MRFEIQKFLLRNENRKFFIFENIYTYIHINNLFSCESTSEMKVVEYMENISQAILTF